MKIVEMECDECGAGVLGDREEARSAHGWGRRKIEGEMKDLCAECLKTCRKSPTKKRKARR